MSTTNEKEIKTVGGHAIVVKEFITYGESQNINDVYRQDQKTVTPGEMVKQADKLGIELVVLSIDGSKEKIVEAFHNLPLIDAKQIAAHIKEVLDPKGESKP